MCRAAPSAHGSPPTKNRRSRKNREIARKSLHRSAGAPPFNVQHTHADREEDPAARTVRRPRATPLSLSQPFSPGRRRCSGAGPAPRSAPTATVPLLRRDVHFALENDGWNCTFECEVHVSASSGARRGRRQARGTPPGPRGGTGCPNLLQRPRSHRSERRETLIFHASSRRRSAGTVTAGRRPRSAPPEPPAPPSTPPPAPDTASRRPTTAEPPCAQPVSPAASAPSEPATGETGLIRPERLSR